MPGRIPGRNFLFVPGPTNIPDRVQRAMVVAMEANRSSKFPDLSTSVLHDLKSVFKTSTGQVFIFPSSGTGAWEAALTNTLSPGDRILAARFGQFSHLWIDMAQRLGFEVEVLDEDNAEHYWHRSDQFDMGLDLTAGRRGQAALATVMTRWLSHLLGIEVSIEPLTELRDAKLSWYVGLDTEATAIGDRLWHGEALDEETNGRVLGLYRLILADPALALEEVGREPVYLIMAMSAQKLVRLKPQNLLTGLPIRHLETVT